MHVQGYTADRITTDSHCWLKCIHRGFPCDVYEGQLDFCNIVVKIKGASLDSIATSRLQNDGYGIHCYFSCNCQVCGETRHVQICDTAMSLKAFVLKLRDQTWTPADQEEIIQYLQQVDDIMFFYARQNIVVQDLHAGNLGIQQGKIVVLDTDNVTADWRRRFFNMQLNKCIVDVSEFLTPSVIPEWKQMGSELRKTLEMKSYTCQMDLADLAVHRAAAFQTVNAQWAKSAGLESQSSGRLQEPDNLQHNTCSLHHPNQPVPLIHPLTHQQASTPPVDSTCSPAPADSHRPVHCPIPAAQYQTAQLAVVPWNELDWLASAAEAKDEAGWLFL